MRVTNNLMVQNAIRHMELNRERIANLQEKIASTKDYQNMSDDPARASVAISLRSTIRTNDLYIKASQQADDWLSANDEAFKQVADIATNATTQILRGLNDSLGSTERGDLADEMDGLLRQALEVANTKQQNKYIFSGYQINTRPYSIVSGPPEAIVHNIPDPDPAIGPDKMQASISPDQKVTTNVDGSKFEPFLNALMQARDALRANDNTALDAAKTALTAAADTINTERTYNGARMRQVRQVQASMENTQIQLQDLLSKNEDTNMTEAIANLRQQETTYQTVLEVSQRAISALNLFDMLR